MAKQWSSIRVQTSTLQRVKQMRRELLDLYVTGKVELPDNQVDGVTVDYLLNRLMDQVAAHRERARRQRRKKPSNPQAGQDSAE